MLAQMPFTGIFAPIFQYSYTEATSCPSCRLPQLSMNSDYMVSNNVGVPSKI